MYSQQFTIRENYWYIDAEREHDVLLVAWVLTSSRYVILQPNIDAVKVKKNTVHQLIDDHHIIGGLNVKYRNP